MHWEGAHVVLRVADSRAITARSEFQIGSRAVEFLPGTGPSLGGAPGIHAPLRGPFDGGDFSLRLEVNGSGAMEFAPLGRETVARLTSN